MFKCKNLTLIFVCLRRICVFTLVFSFLNSFLLSTCWPLRVFLLWLFVLCLSLSLNALLTWHFPCFSQYWVAAAGLAGLASDLPPWGCNHFLCAPLPFLLLTMALIPLAALCLLAACQQWEITFKMEIIT